MTRYIAGQYNVICDRCGFKFKSGELKKDWQGLMVCAKDFETRHPQDLIKIRQEKAIPEWVRPRPEEVFLYTTCTLQGTQGVADVGVADCMRAEFITPY